MHTQQPFRTTWSGWTELFFVFMLVAMYLRGTKLNKKELCAIIVLGTLAASWRSECVLPAAIPVLLLVMCARNCCAPRRWRRPPCWCLPVSGLLTLQQHPDG